MAKRYLILTFLMITLGNSISAQQELKHTRKGNRMYKTNDFSEAEISYRKSIDENPSYNDAMFNLGDALYKQGKYEDAMKSFSSLADSEIEKKRAADYYYNMGNTLFKREKLEESIEAFKNSLRNNPDNKEAKYNLAYVQDLLQKQNQQDQQENQQDQENEQDNKEQEDRDSEGKDQQDKQEDEQEQEQKDQDGQQEQNDKQEQEQSMSKEDAERLLQALAADEQQVQEKVKKAKAARARVRALKNW